ncbi:general transcription factor IIF subunit 1-like isoform X2 [Neopelma chrysocephalum]|uniref:general transcription factor IIF subunit 1-like isoform X1 n=1 Tax=Neopelma chrysocephalum TaxID=114329 RepID=UPI000FCCF41A|nr:general transcription factor IIF subunit 1-like isoform X1 [Neopelma chrysocephalum]XP_027562718.1 general transcription factor IIF subunit 1-like isoform X2 [Neopelma chrysocephalum]
MEQDMSNKRIWVGNVGIWGYFGLPIPLQARMERDMSNKRIYAEEELPESGAGSEFHRKLREEARRKKYGIVLREFRAEDQPWILRVNGKTGRK